MAERVVVAHEDRDLELVVHAQPVQQIAGQHRAGVDVQDLAHPVGGVVFQVLVHPFDGVVVRLADPPEVARDGLGAAQVHVGAVRALGVEGFHVGGADDLHGRGHGHDVAVIGLLLDHIAHPDEPARHEFSLFDAALGLGDQPGEILQCADLEGDRIFPVKRGRIALAAGDPLNIVFHGDERPPVALFDQPREILHIGGVGGLEPRHEVFELSGLARLAVDLLRATVALHHVHEFADGRVLRVDQQRVDLLQPPGRYLQQFSQIRHGNLLSPWGYLLVARKRGAHPSPV